MSEKNYEDDSMKPVRESVRVRKYPGMFFGSDGLDGCQHSVSELLYNFVDDARSGYSDKITLTRYLDHSIQIEDNGPGCPVDWSETEKIFNWELLFCTLYLDRIITIDSTREPLLSKLGPCPTHYTSEFFDAVIHMDGYKYSLHFEKGENVGGLQKEATDWGTRTGTDFHWRPDSQVFTDIDIPPEYYLDLLKNLAETNEGVTFEFRNENGGGQFETKSFCYQNGKPAV